MVAAPRSGIEIKRVPDWSRVVLYAGAAALVLVTVGIELEGWLLAAAVGLLVHATLDDLDRSEEAAEPALIALSVVTLLCFGFLAIASETTASYGRGTFVGLLACSVTYALRWLHPEGMALRDTQLVLFAGFVLGWVGWDAVALGFIMGFGSLGVVAGVMMIRRVIRPQSHLPFGPFLTPSVLISVAMYGG